MTDDAPLRAYANNIGVRATALDLSVDFGFRAGEEAPQSVAQIVMSWEEARVLQAFLTDALARYEEEVGPIRQVRAETSEEEGEQDDDG